MALVRQFQLALVPVVGGARLAKRLTVRTGATLLAIAMVFGLCTLPAGAATGSGSNLTTSPVSVTLSGMPGETVTTYLQLQNNGLNPTPIQVKLEKFRASGDLGQAAIYDPGSNDLSMSWVHFSDTSFIAQPGVWKQIKMTIIIPETAAFGYYYAVVFSPVAKTSPIPGNNAFRGANAILVLLNVRTPGEKNQLQIASFSAAQNIYQYLPVSFSVKIRNMGDIYAAPRGDIYISAGDGSGKTLDTIELNKAQGNVLPGTDRVFALTWDDGFPRYVTKRLNGQIVSDAKGQPQTELSWDLSKLSHLRFGRYTARLVMVYNDGVRDIPLTASVSFWVIPWSILLVMLVVAALVGLGLWSVVRVVVRRPRRIHLG